MKKIFFSLTLVLFFSFGAFAQDLASGNMQVKWTQDVRLDKGFDVIETFEVDGTNFLYCHNVASGKSKVWNLNTGGDPVFERETYSGWRNFVFFKLDGTTYMFAYKPESGHYQFFKMNADGSIGDAVSEKGQWSADWTDFDVTYVNDKPVLLMMRASDGRAKLFEPHF